MVRLILIGKRIYDKFSEDEMTVYAAQVSFFVILSFVVVSDICDIAVPGVPITAQHTIAPIIKCLFFISK